LSELFGIDIAGILSDGLEAAGGVNDLTLTSVAKGTRASGDLTGGTSPTSADHPGKGFYYDERGTQEQGSAVRVTFKVVAIVGASLPSGVVPKPNDVVTFSDGAKFRLGSSKTDPAKALYLHDSVKL